MEPHFVELESPGFVAQSSSTLCRICANNHDYFIHLYSDDNHGLVDKINRLLPISVSNVDSLPCQVCYQCASTILAFSELVDTCLISQKRLECLLAYGDNRCAPLVDSVGHSKDPGDLLSSHHSGIETMVHPQHQRDTEKAGNPVDPFKDTEQEHASDIGVFGDYEVEPDTKKKKKSKLSKCPICGKVFKYLKSHFLSHSETRTHLCSICGAAFKRKDHVNYHRKTVHMRHPDVLREFEEKGENLLTCDICGEIKPSKYSMVVHMKKHAAVSQDCVVCGKNFTMSSLLKEHLMSAHPKISLPCSICGEEIRSGKELHLHKQKHLTSFICDVCGKRFSKPSSLKTHMVIHSEEKPFSCGECGKAFKLKIRLQLHKQSHKNVRPFACALCKDKKFKTKYALAVHNNMHNDVRAYPCPHCPFRARKHYDLVCHIRTHTGEKPYKCEVCGRGFAQAGDMRKHKSTHERHKNDGNGQQIQYQKL